MALVASPLFTVQPRLGLLLLLLVTAWLYAPVGGFDYINWDDGRYVADNPWIEGGLSWRGIVYAFSSTDPFLMPLVRLSYMAESSLLGMDAGHFHLVNVLFHLANTWLLYQVIFLATRRGWLAVLMAAVLALHPQHVEAVAWITERKEVMSGFFGLLSLWWYVVYVQLQQEGQGRSNQVDNARAWSVLAFCASLLCKPMWVTLPFVLLLLDFWPLNRLNVGWKKLLWEKQLYFLLSSVFIMLTLVTFSLDGAITNTASMPWEYRLNKMVLSYGEYLWKGVWPFNLALYYPHPMGNVSSLTFWSVLGMLLAISVLCWYKRPTMPHLLMGWLWFLGMLFPVSGVVEGGMPIGLADRWT
ncbi:MAG: hypothetical protein G8345_16390, partial [Magnetococcales bacterium]|nr:hypothetical protein [Magnetococcales bacterium]